MMSLGATPHKAGNSPSDLFSRETLSEILTIAVGGEERSAVVIGNRNIFLARDIFF